jgi:hypothetical protein
MGISTPVKFKTAASTAQMGISAPVQFKTAASAAGFNVHCNEAPESLAAVSSKPPHQQLVSTSIVTKRHVW